MLQELSAAVKGDDFKNTPVSNAVTALQGRASGVNIVRAMDPPGAYRVFVSVVQEPLTMRIRLW